MFSTHEHFELYIELIDVFSYDLLTWVEDSF